ncbi:hypothetical protein ACFPZ4_32575, partial [Micromonospora harpali]
MDPDLAVEALARALRRGETTTLIADIDWARFAPAFTLVRPSPLIGDLPKAVDPVSAALIRDILHRYVV